MTIREILNTPEHRPWKLPSESWTFYQEWNDAIFVHYQVDLEELKKFVPQELEIDLFEGKAWVSVVAFTMEKIRLKNLPSFPPISDFDEINIRTYVKCKNKAGVYFLSIEGGKSLSCTIAKALSQLPYRFSAIKKGNNKYQSRNRMLNDTLDIEYTIGEELTEKTALDQWLTERYALFQDSKKSINEFEIHHLEWPLSQVDLQELHISYPRFHKLLKDTPTKIHYSKGVKVMAWGKKKKEKTS